MLASAIQCVVGASRCDRQGQARHVPLVENGNTVPMTVSVASPMAARITSAASTSSTRRTASPTSAISISARITAARRFLDPHPPRRQPEGRRDRKALGRVVLVGQRRCRGDARRLHRGVI